MKKKHIFLQKTQAIVLIVSLAFLPIFFTSEFAYATSANELALPSESLSAAVPVPGQPEAALAQTEQAASDAASFLAEGPLTPADSAESSESPNLALSNDPFYDSSGSWGNAYDDLWWLKRVRADDAWTFTRGAGATVAVIDTGLDFNHEDISENIWYNESELNGIAGFDDDFNGYVDDVRGWDFYNWDKEPRDDNGHGSHVAGIIGAVADNLQGIAGIAPESKILSIKVLNSSGSGYVQDVITAIRYAADMAADVINLSLGIAKAWLPKSLRTSLQNAIRYARSKGSIVVAAAGNENRNVSNVYPAYFSEVIAVGAIEPVTDKRAWFSNYGSALDFVAPGVDVLSLRAGGTLFGSSSIVDPDYSRASGTSMSAPIVSGIIALLRSWDPAITFDQIMDRLKKSAVDLGSKGFDSYYGYGLVDAYGALALSASLSLAGSLQSQTSSSSSSLSGPTAFAKSFSLPSGFHPSAPSFFQGYPNNHYAIPALSRWQDLSVAGFFSLGEYNTFSTKSRRRKKALFYSYKSI